MKVPSTTTLSFPTLLPLLTVGKKYSRILFGQTSYVKQYSFWGEIDNFCHITIFRPSRGNVAAILLCVLFFSFSPDKPQD
jgi:hypothetical protein